MLGELRGAGDHGCTEYIRLSAQLKAAGAGRHHANIWVIVIPIDHCHIRKVGLGQLLRCRDSTDAAADNNNFGRCNHLLSQGLV